MTRFQTLLFAFAVAILFIGWYKMNNPVGEAEKLKKLSKEVNKMVVDKVLEMLVDERLDVLRFCLNDKKTQRHLLAIIEQNGLLPKDAHIIKALYDKDFCEPKKILERAKKVEETEEDNGN